MGACSGKQGTIIEKSSANNGPDVSADKKNVGILTAKSDKSYQEELGIKQPGMIISDLKGQGMYRVIKLLGAGAEGEAYLAEDQDGKNWALKFIKLPLPQRMVKAIFREIQIQSELGEGHNNIIRAEEVVLTSQYLGLVIEWAPGGSLTDLITNKYIECHGVGLLMPEDEVRYLFRQVVNAVDYMHRNHVVHRDLKLDNILLSPPYPPFQRNPPYIKLCDFGFARTWDQISQIKTVVGTPDYMSPQIIEADHKQALLYDGTKADIWAMGVLLCVMLIGKFPFEGDSVSTIAIDDPLKKTWLQQNKRAWYENSLMGGQLQYLSPEVKDLLDKMFELDESKRINIEGLRTHPWFMKTMRPHLEEAISAMETEQIENERKVATGAFCSKDRDDAVKMLIEMASSEEFRAQSSKSVSKDTQLVILSRIKLRTVLPAYPKFGKLSLHPMIKPREHMLNL
ncbi:hypothetical protein CEUSTIGMA_g6034.t1 [Chlamydomonas eustigma]|uniref:Protein kinase domain-containing protein n=1 Tax=Chlamydomonas eustigma TaxID=1157962 RepID=A0A250X6A0_9CHLO|nr:hypothetical protein CEUSTIGMA_g6034.t1 [Chlamydomonas eustigma]|eukprot:GAX78595.1 hypothetical protein CEUSTIGMA_g6034.t1 [Chlamydomonas eustigma]